jgi:hypothetical protein
MGLATLVASTQASRCGLMRRPVIFSDSPLCTRRGVDEVHAASRALATMRPASASSVRSPNIMVPRQMGATFQAALSEISIVHSFLLLAILRLSGRESAFSEKLGQWIRKLSHWRN